MQEVPPQIFKVVVPAGVGVGGQFKVSCAPVTSRLLIIGILARTADAEGPTHLDTYTVAVNSVDLKWLACHITLAITVL